MPLRRSWRSASPTGARTARRGPQATESCPRKRAVGIFQGIKRVHNLPLVSQRSRSEAERALGLSTTTRSHQAPPALASSIGAPRCWLVTSPPACPSERYTTAPEAVNKRPGLAQNRYQDSAYLAVAPRAAWAYRPPDPPARGPVTGPKMPKSPSSGVGTNLRRPSHSGGPPRLA